MNSSTINTLPYWGVALIVGGPFLVLHSSEGWKRGWEAAQTRNRERKTRETVAAETTSRMNAPEIREVLAAQGVLRNAESAPRHTVDESPAWREAQRQLGDLTPGAAQEAVTLAASALLRDGRKTALFDDDLRLIESDRQIETIARYPEADLKAREAARALDSVRGDAGLDPRIALLGASIDAIRTRKEQDPDILALRRRIEELEGEIERSEAKLGTAIERFDRDRPKRMRWSPYPDQVERIHAAQIERDAAQLRFDIEYRRIMRVLDCPPYLRWFERLRLQFGRDPVVVPLGRPRRE